MMERRLAGVWLATWLAAGCGGTGPSTTATADDVTPPPVDAAAPDEDPSAEAHPEAFVEARATGASEEEAQEQALDALRQEVLGDAASVSVTVHEPSSDPRRVTRTDAGVEVWLGLSEQRVREVLSAVASQPAPSLPPPFATPVTTLHHAVLEAALCERRRALFEAECEPPDVRGLERQVHEVAIRVRLRPGHEGGVPVDDEGLPIRAASVVVERVDGSGGTRPVPGIPVVARTEPGGPPIARAFTDEEGRATLPVPRDQALEEPLVVDIDRETLLGPVARHWPERQIRLGARPRDLRRWTGVAAERVSGRASDDGVFVDGLHSAMRQRGGRSPMSLEEDERARLLSTPEARRAQVFPELADEWEGRVDYVLIGDVESEFASRMGHNRVWYEARGSLELVDAWTGRTVATVEDSVTAPGLGDDRAARAAHSALAAKLVDALHERLEERDEVASR